MADFPVSTIEPHLLEKVMKKLDFKSCYRLQRTCAEMLEFIRITSTLSIWDNRKYWLSYNRVTGSWKCSIYESSIEYPVKGIFGLRVATLSITSEVDEGENLFLNKPDRFKSLCSYLKKHQITCAELVIHQDTAITKEQYRTLLHIVKPETVDLMTDLSDIYEALLEPPSKIMECVDLHIDKDVFVDVVEKFLPAFPELALHVEYGCDDPIPLCQAVLKMLAHPLPKLRKFIFKCHYEQHSFDLRSEDDLKKIFQGHKTTKGIDEYGDDCTIVEMPSHFPTGSSCVFSRDSYLAVYMSITIPNRGEIKRRTYLND